MNETPLWMVLKERQEGVRAEVCGHRGLERLIPRLWIALRVRLGYRRTQTPAYAPQAKCYAT